MEYGDESSSTGMPLMGKTLGDHIGEEFDPLLGREASAAAFVRLTEFEANSRLARNPQDDNCEVAKLDWDDIHVEALLGIGGFACVSKVSVPIMDAIESSFDGSDGRSSKGTSDTSWGGSGIYALKCLNERTTIDRNLFLTGAEDLATEFALLSNLKHDNIVRIHGVYNGCVSQAFQEDGGYFFLMELLRGTVSDLLRLWRTDLKDKVKAAQIPPPLERIQSIALGIIRGVDYLHKSNIVLRDLKPHNIGFDRGGNVRLFDFGLARELCVDESQKTVPGVAGSWRYMAPEVIKDNGSTFASDIFSFGVLLWELLTLAKPHSSVRSQLEYRLEVIENRIRPNTRLIPTKTLTSLLTECWKENHKKRPTASFVLQALETEAETNEHLLAVNNGVSQRGKVWKAQFSNLKRSVKMQIRQRQ